jgi:excisionase family DNA binding protein
MTTDELLTVAEVAELLKLNQQTIRNMLDRGDLPAVRVGTRRVRILRSDLDEFIGERKRLTQRSDQRVAFDDALGAASKALRSKDKAATAAALRSLAQQALALAVEIEAASTA